MKNAITCGMLLLCAIFSGGPVLGQIDSTKVQHIEYRGDLGKVHFPVSCMEAVRPHTERGLALLHHMTYDDARAAFTAATQADPDCAMGYWGQAMTFIHPLWSDPPSETDFEKGQALVNEARSRGQKTEWEKAYIDAVAAYYAQGWSRDETANLAAFEEGWREVHEKFPDDPEAAAFYALAHMATADPADKSFTKQKRSAEIAEQVLTRVPDHPGAHHYIIHAYDYPPLAEEALEVTRNYGEIAPAIPHALHMSSHIYTRLGLWQESISMNQRSAAAALEHPAGDKISLHYLHALDYLTYAYLQRGQDEKAREVLERLQALEQPVQVHIASAYTFAAVPARVVLERHAWADAAALEPRQPSDLPWDQFPAMEAITHFARGLGAARSGHGDQARQALNDLAVLQEQAAKTSSYWEKQVEIQQLSTKAWLAYQEGNQEEALNTMRRAAEMEATTEKHPVTPGEVLPAHELLADMLLDMGRYEAAQAAYESALERNPNRFHSLYGMGRAAEFMGDEEHAVLYYGKLVDVTAKDAERDRLQHARTFLAEH